MKLLVVDDHALFRDAIIGVRVKLQTSIIHIFFLAAKTPVAA
jgi:DNA-binding NarL/FixJ family response regulator